MIDMQNEQLISFNEASKRLPGNPCYTTLQRWKSRAVNPLETVKFGGRIYTSVEALERFAQKCTDPSTAETQTVKSRRAAIDKHDRELTLQGI